MTQLFSNTLVKITLPRSHPAYSAKTCCDDFYCSDCCSDSCSYSRSGENLSSDNFSNDNFSSDNFINNACRNDTRNNNHCRTAKESGHNPAKNHSECTANHFMDEAFSDSSFKFFDSDKSPSENLASHSSSIHNSSSDNSSNEKNEPPDPNKSEPCSAATANNPTRKRRQRFAVINHCLIADNYNPLKSLKKRAQRLGLSIKTVDKNPILSPPKILSVPIMASLVLSGGLLTVSSNASAAPVFINEFHYDNTGTDIDEGLEIAAAAGTNLDGWQLLFYNGSDGSIYKTTHLGGLIPDQSNGYGVLSFSSPGIQNGPADAFALVDNLGSVMDFISYEGIVTASEGPALGLSSIDVGVSEITSTPVGMSIQKWGLGSDANDFSWVLSDASFADINSGQIFSPSPVPIPASLALFSSALMGLLARKRMAYCAQLKST